MADAALASYWNDLREVKERGDAAEFLAHVSRALCFKLAGPVQGISFKALSTGLTALFREAQDPTASAVFALSCLRDLLASDDTRSHKGAQAETQEQRAPFPASLPYLILDAVSVDPFSISDPTASTDTSQTDEDSSYPATTESSDLVGSTDEAPFAPNLAAAGPGSNATGAAAGALALDAQAVDQAVQLLYEQLQQGNVKMGLRIAAAFRLGEAQVQGRPEVLQGLRESFEAQLQGLELPAGRPQAGGKGALTLAVGLLMQFPVLAPPQMVRTLLGELVSAGLEGLAIRWLVQLGQEERETFVRVCMAADKYKAAQRTVRAFQLQDRFPEVEKVYRERTFARLMRKQLWGVAAQFVGSDSNLQRELVTAMYESDPQQAVELAAVWQLPATFMSALDDPAVRAEAEARRAAHYYPLALPAEHVMMVGTLAAVQSAEAVLSHATVVGLDVEWKPTGDSKASLLQIATPEKAFLFDLLALDGPTQAPAASADHPADNTSQQQEEAGPTDSTHQYMAALDKCLCSVLHNPACLKLGVEVNGDLRKLARSWPTMRAFAHAGPILELRDLWTAYLTHSNPAMLQVQRTVGLSGLSSALLGKPLDKTMQVSDWERRPLTARQMTYAAQDAHVLITLYQRLTELTPNATETVTQAQYEFKANEPDKPRTVPPTNPNNGTQRTSSRSKRTRNGNGKNGNATSNSDTNDNNPGGTETRGMSSGEAGGVGHPSSLQADGVGVGAVGGTGRGAMAALAADGGVCVGPSGGLGTGAGDGDASTSAAEGEGGAAVSAVMALLVGAGLGQCVVTLPATASPKTGPGMHAAQALSVPLSSAVKSMALMYTPPHTHSHTHADAHRRTLQAPGLSSAAVPISDMGQTQGVAGAPPGGGSKPTSQTKAELPLLIVLRGDQRLDMHKVATQLGVSRRGVRMASFDECVRVFGAVPGWLAPFGLASPHIPVWVDHSLAPDTQITAGVQPSSQEQALAASQEAPAYTRDVDVSASLTQPGVQGSKTTLASLSETTQQTDVLQSSEPAIAAALSDPAAHTQHAPQEQPGALHASHYPTAAAGLSEGTDEERLLTNVGCGDKVALLTRQQLWRLLSNGSKRVVDVALQAPSGAGGAGVGGGVGESQAQSADGDGPLAAPLGMGQQARKEISFLLDGMLGRLCRWLRCLGVDAEMVGTNVTRSHLLQQAARSGRVFLTRDVNLAMRRDAAHAAPYVLLSDSTENQLREVAQRWGLTFRADKAMSRCAVCNAAAFELMSLEDARQSTAVPDKVLEIYWMGPKSYSAMDHVEGVLAALTAGETSTGSGSAPAEAAQEQAVL